MITMAPAQTIQIPPTTHIWGIGLEVCIGSNCPGISGTVLDFQQLSQVPEGTTANVLLVPDEVQILS